MFKNSFFYVIIFLFLILQSNAYNEEITINVTINIVELKSASAEICNVSISLETNKQTYNNGEQIVFQNILNNKSLNFKIEYWIEDIFGEIVKKKISTSNLNKKSYTPKITLEEKALFIKNQLKLDCNNLGKNHSKKLVIVRNNFFEEESTFDDEKTAYSSKIISFYTRAKKFSPKIKLFANIQGAGELQLFSDNGTIKSKINGSGTFEFEVPANLGDNKYLLLFFPNKTRVLFKELNVFFKGLNITNSLSDEKKELNISNNSGIKKELSVTFPTGNTLYESKSELNKKKIPFMIIGLFVVLLVILFLKKFFLRYSINLYNNLKLNKTLK